MPRAYVAGPLFNTHERWRLERSAKIFRDDIAAPDSCDLPVALLTGPDQVRQQRRARLHVRPGQALLRHQR